ncbi:hypothetical protein Q8F55_003923 [Vanrija albida]|uniref:Uncharacterized protein n=1 Tax=Vanrija albida TaxID=181172 RepID=A0ABR3Q5B5_9TREE
MSSPLHWAPMAKGEAFPPTAVKISGGGGRVGIPLYAVRYQRSGAWYFGRVAHKSEAVVTNGEETIMVSKFEVLCAAPSKKQAPYKWVKVAAGDIKPARAWAAADGGVFLARTAAPTPNTPFGKRPGFWEAGAPHAHFPSLARDVEAHSTVFEVLCLRPSAGPDDYESAASVPLSRWASIRQSVTLAVAH